MPHASQMVVFGHLGGSGLLSLQLHASELQLPRQEGRVILVLRLHALPRAILRQRVLNGVRVAVFFEGVCQLLGHVLVRHEVEAKVVDLAQAYT